MKLSDTQLRLLSAASRREDGLLSPSPDMQDGASKIAKPLLTQGLVKATKANSDMPIWRQDDDGALALQITKKGLAAIAADEGGPVTGRVPTASTAAGSTRSNKKNPEAR
jgi:hypothetical protein